MHTTLTIAKMMYSALIVGSYAFFFFYNIESKSVFE